MPDLTPSFNTTREQLELTSEERNILWRLRNKKLIFCAGAYLSLSYVLVEAWVRVYPGTYMEAVKELFRFRIYLTWFLLFLFLLSTGYFTWYFSKSVYPLFKDL